jgi:DNA-binding response OmpR family regulator
VSRYGQTVTSQGAPSTAEPARRGLVLVVDDTPAIRELIRVNLQLEQLTVVSADAGEVALDIAAQIRPQVITLDLRLPGLDGLEVLTRLRADPVTADAGILVVSASAQLGDREQALAAGADAFLAKPFDPSALVAEVLRLLDRAQSAAQTDQAPVRAPFRPVTVTDP